MSASSRIEKDKFQALSIMLAEAIRFYAQGTHSLNVFLATHACYTMVHDLAAFYKKQGKIKKIRFWSNPAFLRSGSDVERTFREAANNFRHGDQKSDHIFMIHNQMAHSYLLATIIDYHQLKDALLSEGIILEHRPQSFADIALPVPLVPQYKLGRFSWGKRQMTQEEIKNFFESRSAAVDVFSSLFYHFHDVTQGEESAAAAQVKPPTKHRLSDYDIQQIGKSRDYFDSEAGNGDDLGYRELLIRNHVRYTNKRRILLKARQHWHGLDFVPPVTSYFLNDTHDDVPKTPSDAYSITESVPTGVFRATYEIGLKLV